MAKIAGILCRAHKPGKSDGSDLSDRSDKPDEAFRAKK